MRVLCAQLPIIAELALSQTNALLVTFALLTIQDRTTLLAKNALLELTVVLARQYSIIALTELCQWWQLPAKSLIVQVANQVTCARKVPVQPYPVQQVNGAQSKATVPFTIKSFTIAQLELSIQTKNKSMPLIVSTAQLATTVTQLE